MTKAVAGIGIAVALAVAAYVLLFSPNDAQAPIVDPTCQPGYVLVGEGCMPVKDACELGGDGYYFDEAQQECVSR
ncbi:MAG: hypothetical protein WAZ27_02180 [Minisyncoccia bacterium]